MQIAILETGRINAEIADRFPRYPDMFRQLFAQTAAPDLSFVEVAVIDGDMPASVDEYDGYLVTGSAAGVYDSLPWIAPLMDFIRAAQAADKPLVGICFGHQIIAHALGGHAEKWHGGWGLGVHDVTLHDTPAWMPSRDSVKLIHIHQDQVVRLPGDATHLGSTDFCANAAFYIGDNVFCMQGHPEFERDYTAALMAARTETMGADNVAAATQSLETGHEGVTIANWIVNFFTRHAASRAAAA
ncbi:MAG: gamma-glutamyl-gamma-aminobutyrate hydrolase family protein [Rhodobiaceae bacterium]